MHRSFAALALAMILAFASPAAAKPTLPRPFERRVDDADLIVIARLKTTPALVGDVFEAEIDEVLKGKLGEGPLRVRAHLPDEGCTPLPPGSPRPASFESRADGDKLALFLDAPVDGVRQSRDPIVLRPTEFVSSWHSDRHQATAVRETIRALVRLDSEDDPAKAADLWVEGVPEPTRGQGLLAACLVVRIEAAARGIEAAASILGERVAARAVRDFPLARSRLLDALELNSQWYPAVRAARACLPPRDDAELKVFDSIASYAAVVATRNADFAVETLRLWFELDRSGSELVLADALSNSVRPETSLIPISEATRDYLRAHPERERVLLETVVKLLDDPKTALSAETLLSRVTGEDLHGADAWRAWWKKR